jgi:hypothetical protein
MEKLVALALAPQESMLSRQELVGSAAAALKSLAQSCRIPVLVTNQVGEGGRGAMGWGWEQLRVLLLPLCSLVCTAMPTWVLEQWLVQQMLPV